MKTNPKFSITVYCGATTEAKQIHVDLAHDLGEFIGQNDWALYYGGSTKGLMGAVAESALKVGGEVHGISFENEFLATREPRNDNLTSQFVAKSIHARKELLHANADVIVVLPGGLGTLDETFEALTMQYLGILDAPILFLNNQGYWNPVEVLLQHLTKEKFVKDPLRLNYKMINSLAETKKLLLSCAKEWQESP